VDVKVKEGDVIDLGKGVTWKVHETPGHAPCQLAFMNESTGVMAIGDATGFFNPEKDALWPNYFGGLETYCNSIKKLAGLGAKSLILSHNGFRSDAGAFLAKALRIAGDYHQEMLDRTGNGEEPESIIEEKSAWVKDIANQMPLKIILQLTGLLIKLSQKAGPKPEGYFTL
jgi:glyoxylase-like metal-dependent hydrolase (beta-lactamase superfamily II)